MNADHFPKIAEKPSRFGIPGWHCRWNLPRGWRPRGASLMARSRLTFVVCIQISGQVSAFDTRWPASRACDCPSGFVRGERCPCIYHGWQSLAEDGALPSLFPPHPDMTRQTVHLRHTLLPVGTMVCGWVSQGPR